MKRIPTIVTFIFLIVLDSVTAQPWEQNNAIFNPSGIPSLPFSQPRFADLDADGDPDMIIGSTADKPFYMENTGTASNPVFIPGPDIFSAVQPLDAEVGVCYDIDNDGDLDFIAGGFNGLSLYTNTGNIQSPVFEKTDGFFSGLQVGMNPVPSLADVDNDNDPDLLTGLSESGTIKLYINTGSPSSAQFDENNITIIGDVGLYAYPVFCDMDYDDDPDILSGRDGHGFIYYQNTGNPSNPVWETNNALFEGIGEQTYWNSPDLADLTGESMYDLIFGSSSGPLNYYINTGSPEIPVWQLNTALFGGVLDVGGASNPWFCDFDNDGDQDLFSGSQLGNIKYFENTGSPSGPAWEENSGYFTTLKHSIYSAVAVGNLNGDNLPDAIVGDLSGNLYYHRNTGFGFYFDAGALSAVNLGGWSAPRLVDLDDDGDLDIVAGSEDGKLNYIENQGTATNPVWTLLPGFFTGIDVGTDCAPSIADFDGDGDLDILTGNLSGDVQFFENIGDGWVENPEPVEGLSVDQNATPALADLDGDGDLDLTLGQYTGTFDYYKNNRIITSNGEHPPMVSSLSLSAFPNPFSGSTTLCFNIPPANEVSLLIVDVHGQPVYSSVYADMKPGRNLLKWDAGNIPPGTYIVRIISGGKSESVKVVKHQGNRFNGITR